MEIERVKKLYAIYSYFYDGIFGRLYSPGRKAAIRLMDIRPGDEILEVGVGTGISLPHYPRHARLVGIDISREMLEKARKRKEAMGLSNVVLQEMNATRLDFSEERFDKVIAAHIIALVPEPLKVIEEMKRVCKEGGELYIINYTGIASKYWAMLEELLSPLRRAMGLGKSLDLEATLSQAGLDIEHQERVNLLGMCSLIRCRKS